MSNNNISCSFKNCAAMNGSTPYLSKTFTLEEEQEFMQKHQSCGRPLDPKNPGSSIWVRRGYGNMDKEYPKCKTAYDIFQLAVTKYENEPCIGTRELLEYIERTQSDGKKLIQLRQGNYKFMTYREVDREIDSICKGLLHIGVGPGDKVAFYAETRAEWFIAAEACWKTSVCVSTVYTTLGDDGILYAINQIECSVIITSQECLERLRKIIDKLPHVRKIVYMKSINPTAGDPKPFDNIELFSYEAIRKFGTAAGDVQPKYPRWDDAAVLMYTSGSSGIPKGVIISHSNLIAAVRGDSDATWHFNKNDVYVAYLPLAHIMEMSIQMTMLCKGIRVGYSSPFTLTDAGTAVMPGSTGDCTVLQPTVMATVPLVLDRVKKTISSKVEAKSAFTQAVFAAAFHYKSWWMNSGHDTPFLNDMLFGKMKAALGGKMRSITCGAAPLSADTQVFIRNCLCTIMTCGYGLTETTGGITICDPRERRTNCVGPPLLGAMIRLETWEEGGYTTSDVPNPRGEIIVGGEFVAQGYYKNEEETAKCFFEENGVRWFRTGDIGEILSDGALRIIDRKKDLIKLQAGEYVAPGKVEAILKTSPLVDNVCVHGNGLRNFVVALVCPIESKLTEISEELGKPNLSLEAMCKDSEITQRVLTDLQQFCRKNGLVRLEIPKYVRLCSETWNPESDLVTAALKIRRLKIYAFYAKQLDDLYKNDN